MKEEMVPVKFPNGYVTEMRKPLADRHVKDKVVVLSTAAELATYRGLTSPASVQKAKEAAKKEKAEPEAPAPKE